mmetsp:Transcript_57536/g.107846  ORF Transcript_57536/g.107846 Transcript_57536/m.107846 type:complete len:95 (+) Transcript_57536:303-587(+)
MYAERITHGVGKTLDQKEYKKLPSSTNFANLRRLARLPPDSHRSCEKPSADPTPFVPERGLGCGTTASPTSSVLLQAGHLHLRNTTSLHKPAML